MADLLQNHEAYCQVHSRGGALMKVRNLTVGLVIAGFTLASAAPALAQNPKAGDTGGGSGARSNPGNAGGGETAVSRGGGGGGTTASSGGGSVSTSSGGGSSADSA